jgi:hypothetical protein
LALSMVDMAGKFLIPLKFKKHPFPHWCYEF